MPKVSEAYLAARRDAILEAAVTCFDRRGLHATTTDDIAVEAGISAGALYRYFEGKDAIVEAIAAERHAGERALLARAGSAADPRTAVLEFVDRYFAWISEPDERRRRRVNVHVWAEALANPRIAAVVAEGLTPAASAVELVTRAVADGSLPAHVDPRGFVGVVLALLQGFILQAAWDPDLDVDRFRRTCTDVLDCYLAPRSAPPATAVARAQR
jgi:AcrR family transcriptional regulator